jgi:hypothetical protein
MKSHRKLRNLLYEYHRGELSGELRIEMGTHLRSCDSCSSELKSLQELFEVFPVDSLGPSEERPAEFWRQFVQDVETSIQLQTDKARREKRSGWVSVRRPVFTRPRLIAAGGVLVSCILIFFAFIWRAHQSGTETIKSEQPRIIGGISLNNDRLVRYFDKSKALLVGLTNIRIPEDQKLDLTVEKRVSRELVRESRGFESQPMDARTAGVVKDLKRILIGLSNIREDEQLPHVEMIRSGIERENLLFRIRMAELGCDSAWTARNMYSSN